MTVPRRLPLVLGAILLVCAVSGTARADSVPTTTSFQGRLTDNTPQQNPLNGTVQMTFSIWELPTGGSSLWQEPASGTLPVQVTGGIFNVILGGNGVPLPSSVFVGGSTRYLEITVDGETLSPRQLISTVAYAHQADASTDAAALGGLPPASWQVRVAGACPSGFAIRSINPDGTVVCVAGPTGPPGPQGVQGPQGIQGVPGTTGQSVTTAYGTTALTVTSSTFTPIPGLSITLSVPSGGLLYIATDGGVATTSAAASGFSSVNVALFIDGALSSSGGYRRLVAANNGGIGGMIESWSISLSQALSPGTHTIHVGTGLAAGSNAIVSGDGTSILQGELTVMILKQ